MMGGCKLLQQSRATISLLTYNMLDSPKGSGVFPGGPSMTECRELTQVRWCDPTGSLLVSQGA